jgi:hypothetical protein
MTKSEGCAALLDLVRRDLELVAVGIAEINRVRNFVILEFEFDSTRLEFLLCSGKIFPVRAKGEMKHSNFAVPGRFRLFVRGEQGDPGIPFADKRWHPIPHAFVKPLKPEDVDVPFGGSFNVAHAHGYVINTFEVEHSEIHLRFQNDSAQAFESVEIAIKGNKLGAMLDRERGQVRVTGQISSSANQLQEAAQNCCMIFTRMDDNCIVRP